VEQLQYIVDLWRDPDPGVRASVDAYFEKGGEAAVSLLRSACIEEMVPDRKALMEAMLNSYCKRLVITGLKEIALRCADVTCECALREAGYLIALLSDPLLSRAGYMEQIMPPVLATLEEISDAKTGIENVNLLNHVFYKRYGFSVASPFDMSLDNTLLMKVAKGRVGSPFAISLLYFIVAQSAGLPVYPLCFTGGFVPVYTENDKILFNINVFHQGEIFVENNISKMVKNQAAALGVNVDVGEAVVKKDQSILVMYLEFLQMLYSNNGDTAAQMDIDDAIEALGGHRFLTIESDEDEW